MIVKMFSRGTVEQEAGEQMVSTYCSRAAEERTADHKS